MSKPIRKIGDPRLDEYTKRTRSGVTQEFYKGNDARDWDRYGAEGGGKKPNVTMHLKADTIHITPPKKSYYADLIDGVWWWVEGCAECNGQPCDWMTYIECDNHDRCRRCEKNRHEIEGGSPWGGKNGWICKPCREIEHDIEKQAALDVMPKEYNDWDYHDLHEIKCPYCDYEFSDSWERSNAENEEEECPRCDNTFTVTAVHSVTFDCDRKEK